jgi:hypothetical protein
MLHADKKNLESDFRVRMLHIREKELMFFVRNCQNMANLAALIACMAQSGLIFTKYIDFNLCGQGLVNLHSKELLCAEFTYPIAIFITMGLCLLCMWVSMLVSLLAPGLALRGPDGSMHECVRMIGEEYEYALAILACALAMFFVSAILWSWASQHLPVAIVLTIILVASARVIWSMTRYTVTSFSIAKGDIVTGQMTSARSPTRPMWAHGYVRLQEETSRRMRRPTPTLDQHHPPPKPARVWWGLRLVEHVRAPRAPPPPPLTHAPHLVQLPRNSPTQLTRGSSTSNWRCNRQACTRRGRSGEGAARWSAIGRSGLGRWCRAARPRAQAARSCSGESGPSPALAPPRPRPGPALAPPWPRPSPGPDLNQARAALGAANQRRAASPPLAKARAR